MLIWEQVFQYKAFSTWLWISFKCLPFILHLTYLTQHLHQVLGTGWIIAAYAYYAYYACCAFSIYPCIRTGQCWTSCVDSRSTRTRGTFVFFLPCSLGKCIPPIYLHTGKDFTCSDLAPVVYHGSMWHITSLVDAIKTKSMWRMTGAIGSTPYNMKWAHFIWQISVVTDVEVGMSTAGPWDGEQSSRKY